MMFYLSCIEFETSENSHPTTEDELNDVKIVE